MKIPLDLTETFPLGQRREVAEVQEINGTQQSWES